MSASTLSLASSHRRRLSKHSFFNVLSVSFDDSSFCRELKLRGCDFIDVSSGGNSPKQIEQLKKFGIKILYSDPKNINEVWNVGVFDFVKGENKKLILRNHTLESKSHVDSWGFRILVILQLW